MNNDTRDEWLAQIRQNPSDWQTMLIFADWLEESGDLLAAEQWRWIAATHRYWRYGWVMMWPRIQYRQTLCRDETIEVRCMPTYPTTLAEIEAYLQASR